MPGGAPGRCAAALFSGSGLAAETMADFRTAEWEKLLSNVTANPLTALTG
jgi:2-dehydropantoate 2-reductase